MSVKWIKTDKHVYGAIYREHYNNLGVFSSCTAPDGDLSLGLPYPYILTDWGFKGADEPLIRSVGRKDSKDQKDYEYEYFIALVTKDEECREE